MDKKSHAGYHQQHHQRELIEIESEIRLDVSSANPGRQELYVWNRDGRELNRHPKRHGESGTAEGERHRRNGSPRKSAAK